MSVNGTAQVQCFLQTQPSNHHGLQLPDPEEVRVTLLRGLHGSRSLCSTMLNFTEPRETDEGEGEEVQCSAEVTGGVVQVTVSGLKAPDTDLYRCEVEILYPPPYLRLTGNGTLIHVQDICDLPVRERVQQSDEEEAEEGKEPISAPVVVLVILIMFVLLIIVYFQTLQCERGMRDSVVPAAVCC
nr:PREDICTED: T-cell-specific surface glycoprotein CD28-like [Paralichthys olivaceus]